MLARRSRPRASRYSSPRRRASLSASTRSPARAAAAPPRRRRWCGTTSAPTRAGSAVPAAVVELLAEQPVDDAVDVLPEVGPDRDRAAVDARLHPRPRRTAPRRTPSGSCQRPGRRSRARPGQPGRRRAGGAAPAWAASTSTAVLGRSRSRSPRKQAPPAHWPSSSRAANSCAPQPCSATLARSAATTSGGAAVRSPEHLPADRGVAVEQPVEDGHGRQTTPAPPGPRRPAPRRPRRPRPAPGTAPGSRPGRRRRRRRGWARGRWPPSAAR